MKIREVISQTATIDESSFNSYDDLINNKKLDKEIGDEAHLIDQKWAELMNNKRQAMHLKKLWNIKVAAQRIRQAAPLNPDPILLALVFIVPAKTR